jgi:DNA-binding MurR/RpiR family transcriptional regulator
LLGLGASSFVAGYGAHLLMPYLPRVWPLSMNDGTEAAARRLTRGAGADVLVAISLPRYSAETVRLARFARERGVSVVAITDSPRAPLVGVAQIVLPVPAEHAVMPSSAVGALAMVEALAAEVMQLSPDAVRIAQELSEAVLSDLTPH